MKTKLHCIVTLVLLATLAACGGSGGDNGQSARTDLSGSPSDGPESQVPTGTRCGGIAGTTCPAGEVCVDVTDDACDPATGADCPSLCQPDPANRCSSDAECVAVQQCSICADGQQLCTTARCVDGGCVAPVLDCPKPPPAGCGGLNGATCPPGFACVDDPSDVCSGGPAVDCPGICEPSSSGMCNDDADCPALRAPCSVCADGSASCPRSFCVNGQCNVEMSACPTPQPCGGIAGLRCPAGFVCTDNRMDTCDPTTGADCGGVCIPEQQPPASCGGISGAACADGAECVDDPNDDCVAGPAADCPGVCQPKRPGQCTVDADCPELPMRCAVCADGSTACAISSCVGGSCQISYPSCAPPSGCDVEPCKPGYVCVALPVPFCDPANTGATCAASSTCVPEDTSRRCGGIAGDTCPPGFRCADEPMDSCDPQTGGADCPGICEPDRGPECMSDADCPQIYAPCSLCADGSSACPHAFCTNGLCGVSIDSCSSARFCGGIAGFPCPDGLQCIDDPSDTCDPQNGGADCGGICVRKPSA